MPEPHAHTHTHTHTPSWINKSLLRDTPISISADRARRLHLQILLFDILFSRAPTHKRERSLTNKDPSDSLHRWQASQGIITPRLYIVPVCQVCVESAVCTESNLSWRSNSSSSSPSSQDLSSPLHFATLLLHLWILYSYILTATLISDLCRLYTYYLRAVGGYPGFKNYSWCAYDNKALCEVCVGQITYNMFLTFVSSSHSYCISRAMKPQLAWQPKISIRTRKFSFTSTFSDSSASGFWKNIVLIKWPLWNVSPGHD